MLKKFIIFIMKLFSKMKDDNIVALSAQLTYFILLGIFPFLILTISLLCNYSYYIIYVLNSMKEVLPEDVFKIVSNIVYTTVNSCNKPVLSSSFIVLLWSSTAGSATIINAINRAYGFTVKRNYLFMRIEGIIFAAVITLLMFIVFALVVMGNEIILFMQNYIKVPNINFDLIHVFRYAMPFVLLFLIFSLAFKLLTYEKVGFVFVVPGALFSSIGFIIGSYAFSNYIGTKLKYYSNIYGNLSGMVVFLIWIFLLSVIFLTGAEINYFTGKYSYKKKD